MYWSLGAFAPDKPARLNDSALTVASGVYPMSDGYRPVGLWTQAYSSIGATVKGAAAFTSNSGTSSIIAGTQTALFKAWAGGWESIGAGFSLQGDQRWRFAQFGGLGIATNGADPMQKIDLSTLTVSALGGSPPRAETLAVVGDFLFAGVVDGDALKIQWSGRNNAEFWTPAERFSDFQKFPDGGRINGILSGEYAVILQRNAIRRGDFIGGNTVFAFDVVSTNIGCVSPHSVAQWGRLGFFISDEGPAMWDGSQAVQVGDEEWSRTFRNAYEFSDYKSMSTAIDPSNGVVMWAMPDKIWCYNWRLQRATTIPYVSPIVFSGVTKGISIDETDPAVGSADDNLDGAALVTLDDDRFKGGDPRFYVFSSGNALGEFSGNPMTATFTGNDVELFRDRSARLKWSRPDVNTSSNVTLSFLEKQRLGDSGATSSFSTLMSNGDMPTRTQARYLRPTLTVSSGSTWTYAKGVNLNAEPGSRR